MLQNLPDNLLIQSVETLELSPVNFNEVHSNNIMHSASNKERYFNTLVKRIADILFAAAALIILSPFLLLIALFTRLSSKGSIIYTQRRIGYKGKSFIIYKFRSMYINAELNGPCLSSENDERVTKWGRIMRKWRLDELPQLWNILKGEMTFVGPRPERSFYIKEIGKRTNEFIQLLNVKPGLTSWGMVQFGYASSVDEMIKRMQYDVEYLNKASLLFNLKILLYSLRIIFLGKGR